MVPPVDAVAEVASKGPEISLAAEKVASVFGFPITNSLLTSWLVVLLLVVLGLLIRRKVALVPRGIQNVAESILEFLLNLGDQVTGDRKQTERFFPLVATIFIFIVTANWFGLLPLVGPLEVETVHAGHPVVIPLLRSANADLNTTLALAIIAVVSLQVFGIATIGFFKYAGKFFNFHSPILFFVGILELIGEVAKMISFSFRLFGNVFAGEVLLMVVGSLVAYLAPLPFYGLELFVGFIQALVFSILTLVFLKMATAEAH
ncbi:MAG: F0F1 ATP synthase subunit A [Patescibacteria group bacterium]|nr:F0F1 ATP synthase subunit A [Patescibacteria group bacterium]